MLLAIRMRARACMHAHVKICSVCVCVRETHMMRAWMFWYGSAFDVIRLCMVSPGCLRTPPPPPPLLPLPLLLLPLLLPTPPRLVLPPPPPPPLPVGACREGACVCAWAP